MLDNLALLEPPRKFDRDHPRLMDLEIHKVHRLVYVHLRLIAPTKKVEVDYLGQVLCMCESVESFLHKKREFNDFCQNAIM